jgi:hypothetical protein
MTPDQMRAIVEEAIGKYGLPRWYVMVASLVVVTAVSIFAWWLRSYMQSTGERFARTEGLKAILREVRHTTQTAEEVKATISNDLWLKQKRWDLRRDVYAQLLEAFESLAQSLPIMMAADVAARTQIEARDVEGATFHKQRYQMARERAIEALRNARRAHALGSVFLTAEARAIVDDLATAWTAALEGSSQGALGAFSELSEIIDRAQKTLTAAARIDLIEGER